MRTILTAAALAAMLSTTAYACDQCVNGQDRDGAMSAFGSWNDPQRMAEQGQSFRSAWPSWRGIEHRAARAASGQSWSRGYFSGAAPANGHGTGFNGSR